MCISIGAFIEVGDVNSLHSPFTRPIVSWPSQGEVFLRVQPENGTATTFALAPPSDVHVCGAFALREWLILLKHQLLTDGRLDISTAFQSGFNELSIVQSASLSTYTFLVNYYQPILPLHPSLTWDSLVESLDDAFTDIPLVHYDDLDERFSQLPWLR